MSDYRSLDDVVENVIGSQFITRRTLMENLRPGRKYAGCASKISGKWAFSNDDLDRLKRRFATEEPVQELDPPPSSLSHLPSGISPRSPRVRRSA